MFPVVFDRNTGSVRIFVFGAFLRLVHGGGPSLATNGRRGGQVV
jgi:hypothetical protein